jgi:hypothetical protein
VLLWLAQSGTIVGMATTDPFADITDDVPHTPATLRDFYLKKARRTTAPVRQVFVQRRQNEADRSSTLAAFVNGRHKTALDLYLLLLALEPVVVDSPLSLQTWAMLLGPKVTTATTANAFKVLKDWGLVHREPGKAVYKVRPLPEDRSTDPYIRPDGTADFKQWYFSIPHEYWTKGHADELSLPGKAMMLVLLAGTSKKTSQNVAAQQVPRWYGFSERTAERGYRELRLAKLTQERETYERDPNSPIKLRKVYYRAFYEPFDTGTRLDRQATAAKAMKNKNGSAEDETGSKSAPTLGSKGVA